MRISDWSSDVCSSDLGDPDALPGAAQVLQEEELAIVQHVGRAGRQGQHTLAVRVRHLRLPAQFRELVGSPEPVLYKGELHRLHRWPGNAQVGVAPRAHGRAAAEVLVAEVQPADKGHVAVRNQYLAVVAEVQDRKSTRLNSSH